MIYWQLKQNFHRYNVDTLGLKYCVWTVSNCSRDCRGCDRMVVGYTTTYVKVCNQYLSPLTLWIWILQGVLDITLYDKVVHDFVSKGVLLIQFWLYIDFLSILIKRFNSANILIYCSYTVFNFL